MNTIYETAFSNYFLLLNVLGSYASDRRALFMVCARNLCIPDERAEELFSLADSSDVNGIVTVQDFLRYRRIRQYRQLNDDTADFADPFGEVINIKGKILTENSNLSYLSVGNSEQGICGAIVQAVADGNINFMRICGLMYCESIFMPQNTDEGMRLLCKAANWLDVFSIACVMRYCKALRPKYITYLRVAVEKTAFASFADELCAAYNIESRGQDPTACLIAKAFGSGHLKRAKYDSSIARVLFSPVLSLSDKKKIVFSGSAAHISAVLNLPLKLGSGEQSGGAQLPARLLVRDKSGAKSVTISLGSGKNQTAEKPVCVCCESKYLLGLQAESIAKALPGVRTEIVEVSLLSREDVQPVHGNYFLRNISENNYNCFVFVVRGEVDRVVLSAICAFACRGKRADYHVSSLGISLDLSGVGVICLSDGANRAEFCEQFRMVDLNTQEAEGNRTFLGAMVREKSAKYGLASLSVSKDAYACFKTTAIDDFEQAMEMIINTHACRGKNIKITGEQLLPCIQSLGKTHIGFGGN